MNYSIIAYSIYTIGTVYIIYFLGKYFHKHGRVFILNLFKQQVAQTDSTNNILLILYYLLNMGYAIIQLYFWKPISSLSEAVAGVLSKLAVILLILAVIHYCNMLVIYLLSNRTPKIDYSHTN